MKPVRDPFAVTHRFTATLFHTGGKGGWTFAPLPKSLKLPVTGSWGMTPVMVSENGMPATGQLAAHHAFGHLDSR